MNMKLEVVVIPVSDVERAKRFYENLGFRLDVDIVEGNYRAVHLTPPQSQASILFGKGVTNSPPGCVDGLLLAVDDIDEARRELISRGAAVSEVFHDAGGSLGGGFIAGTERRAPGRDPQDRSYASYASFRDPDGNGWLVQEIKERLPGREWEPTNAQTKDVPALAELLKETAEQHDHYEKTHPEHHWWDWYAPYLAARQKGSSPEEAAAVADRYMEDVYQLVGR